MITAGATNGAPASRRDAAAATSTAGPTEPTGFPGRLGAPRRRSGEFGFGEVLFDPAATDHGHLVSP
jgi:hypothetical protein